MLADGASAGIEQALNRVLFILLLLLHHRAVLSTGIAVVLWCDTVAVFGEVAIGSQKVSTAAKTLTGRVTVLQSLSLIHI